mgnify:CR=1 FL=1
MQKFGTTFDPLYTNMIAAGEAGGILDTILQRLAQFIEKIVKLKRALLDVLDSKHDFPLPPRMVEAEFAGEATMPLPRFRP